MPDFNEFVTAYYEKFASVLREFDKSSLGPIKEVLENVAREGGTLWIAGNGGSASISDHAVCDTTKGAHTEGEPPIRSISLAANNAMLTAIGNDLSYSEVFSKQLEFYLDKHDALLVVSSSGDSPNVVRACELANERGIPTIAFVGFAGGRLKDIARHCVHVPVDNYGIAEDTHQSLMHVLTQYLKAAGDARGSGMPGN